MRIIADLHIHTKYSRATSREMNIASLSTWARVKGIDLIGTGDFTHPAHFAAIEEELAPASPGLFVNKGEEKDSPGTERRPVHFMLTAEVSNIYKQDGRTRKIHSLIFAPTLVAAQKINSTLARLGNVGSDGRPIFGFGVRDLVKIVLDADPEAMLVPAHVWTPWFSIFGSRSGFDSIEECFGEYAKHIHAIETGLSSDPAMNRRVSALDNITLLSNSDAHSPAKLGREANVFDAEMDYYELMRIIKERDRKKFLYTVEFYPEEGKYHADGHRDCGILFTPDQTAGAHGLCPVCTKPLTVGVLSRVEELADRDAAYAHENAVPARHMVPLVEIIAETMSVGPGSVRVGREYKRITTEAGSEFAVLLDMDIPDIEKLAGPKVAEGVQRVRSGELSITPGFDGEFGKIRIFSETDKVKPKRPVQMGLL